jgi:peroxiredoxin
MTASGAATAFVIVWSVLCALAAGVFLVLAFVNWRSDSRPWYLAWFLVLGASPIVATLIRLGMLHWVFGVETLAGRSGRITSGIAVTLLPAVGLLAAAIVRARRAASPTWKTKLTALAAAPFVVSALHSAAWFEGDAPGDVAAASRPVEAAVGGELPPVARRTADPASLIRVGDRAPAVDVHTDAGLKFNLAEQSGKLVLLNFYASWCGPCIAELPHLEEIWKANRNNERFSMLVIGREETPEQVAAFREKHGFTFPMAADVERKIFSQFATESIPRTYLVSGDGTVQAAVLGFREDEMATLRKLIEAELAK